MRVRHGKGTRQFRGRTEGCPFGLQVFAIDEAQFFEDLMEFCVQAAEQDGKLVLVAGLDGDFRRQPFGQARGEGFGILARYLGFRG